MLPKHQTTKISKALSYVLRHNPSSIGLELDHNGWAAVKDLLTRLQFDGERISLDVLKYVVATNNKNRFSFNDDFTKIRASQGHSIHIDLGYTESKPPATLYHGTAEKWVQAIMQTSLHKMNRHHVHLSTDKETAISVGKRHGRPAVLTIKAEEMYKEGFIFYVSDNGVWLTAAVPVRFISLTS